MEQLVSRPYVQEAVVKRVEEWAASTDVAASFEAAVATRDVDEAWQVVVDGAREVLEETSPLVPRHIGFFFCGGC